MGVTQAAGLSLKWFRDNFCVSEKDAAKELGLDSYELMGEEAEHAPAGSNGIIYLPYLMGERTPHLNPNARGVFFGLSAMHTRKDLLRAVMEGVCYSLRDCLEIIKETGIEVKEVRASGGGGKSPLWRQMQSDILNCNIKTINSSEGPALGVAILAGVGVGEYKSVEEACEAVIEHRTTQSPNPALQSLYNQGYNKYREIYKQLEKLF
jgi:xylulokinase